MANSCTQAKKSNKISPFQTTAKPCSSLPKLTLKPPKPKLLPAELSTEQEQPEAVMSDTSLEVVAMMLGSGKHGKHLKESPTIATIKEDLFHSILPVEETSKKHKCIFEDGFDENEDADKVDEFSDSKDSMRPQVESPTAQKPWKNKKSTSDLQVVPFKVNFAIPLKGADEVVSLLSDISWKDFHIWLADTLGIAPKSVAMAYQFSAGPSSAHYLHLKSAEHLAELFCMAKTTLKTICSNKPFFVEIKNLEEGQDKKGKQLAKGYKNKKAQNDTDSERSNGDSDDGTTIDGEKVTSKNRSGPQWVAQIEKDNICTEHPGHACPKTLPNGHHQLTKDEKRKGYYSTTVPPWHLKLEDAPQKNWSTGVPSASSQLHPQPPFTPAPSMMGYPGAFGNSMPFTPYPVFPDQHHRQFSQHMGCHYQAPSSPLSRLGQHHHSLISPQSMWTFWSEKLD
ncbi:hypothetical protein BYT27DRAFT_7255545 [Phlegmacium glaucopus]|nr:hypothetical protein BYT27DRAFT_7255545 [Phlegmacium glaucopus]